MQSLVKRLGSMSHLSLIYLEHVLEVNLTKSGLLQLALSSVGSLTLQVCCAILMKGKCHWAAMQIGEWLGLLSTP